jgi:hypothetical protein
MASPSGWGLDEETGLGNSWVGYVFRSESPLRCSWPNNSYFRSVQSCSCCQFMNCLGETAKRDVKTSTPGYSNGERLGLLRSMVDD